MKKVHVAPKNKSFDGQRPFCEVPLVRAISLGAVMAALLSGVSPVFASHLSSTGSKVQSVSAGAISASVAHGRVGVANGDRSCGVDQVVSRSSSRSGKKVSAKEQYKKLAKNQLSDGSGGYSFASVNALTSASARSSINLDVAESDWFLEENSVINWSDNTRSIDATGARVTGGQTRGVIEQVLCNPGGKSLCICEEIMAMDNNFGIALRVKATAIRGSDFSNYNPITNELSTQDSHLWKVLLANSVLII
ncbi:hypothetical protein [Bartonella bovis]|uniref:hypothetical protein n=1 Tax=Bartonella bovis TaxID=155194 RepID=UPI0012602088|nr:hypothetical protein [Bartonella bovis]